MGLYCEHLEQVKISHLNWDHITYIDLEVRASKYRKLLKRYQETVQARMELSERIEGTEVTYICKQFLQKFEQSTLPFLYEIDSNHRSMMLSIGYNTTDNDRVRRGIGNTFRRLVNVLNGVYTRLDLQYFFNRLLDLANNHAQNLNKKEELIRVVQSETDALNHTLQNFTEHQQKIGNTLQYLQKLNTENKVNINKNTLQVKVLEQVFLFEILLNQYAFETQNLVAIIYSALDGKIHTSVFTSTKLIKELREIKLNLPAGTALPVELYEESMTDYLIISDISIFYQDNYLIFTIGIPLITYDEYYLYHPILIPIPYSQNTLVLIAPEIDLIAQSIDNEQLFSLRLEQWDTCRQVENYTICKSNQPIYHRSNIQICEISLLNNPQNLPKTCKPKLVSLEIPIWHRSIQTNSWIYFTRPDFCTLVCTDPSQNTRFVIAGVGRITKFLFCEIHTQKSIFVPLNKNLRNINLHIVPENLKNNLLNTLAETL